MGATASTPYARVSTGDDDTHSTLEGFDNTSINLPTVEEDTLDEPITKTIVCVYVASLSFSSASQMRDLTAIGFKLRSGFVVKQAKRLLHDCK